MSLAPVTPDSLYDLVFVSEPVVHPLKDLVAYVASKATRASADSAPAYLSALQIVDSRDTAPRFEVPHISAVARPAFSPDGSTLAYLAPEPTTGNRNIWILDLGTGSTRPVTKFVGGVNEFAWIPGGRSLVVIGHAAAPEPVRSPDGVAVIERLHYKLDGVGLRRNDAPQLHLVDLKDPEGKAKCLTELPYAPSDLAVSNNGQYVYFAASVMEHDDDRWLKSISRLELLNGRIEHLLADPMSVTALAPSPDDRHIAILAAPHEHNFANLSGLWFLEVESGDCWLASDEFNGAYSIRGDARFGRNPNTPVWTDNQTVLINRNLPDGSTALCAASLGPNSPELVIAFDGVITSFDHRAGKTAFVGERTEIPGELFTSVEGHTARVTTLNVDWCVRHQLARESGPHPYGSADETDRVYWYMEPANPRDDDAVVLQVHAGAQTIFGLGFFLEFQVMASLGYRVLYGNPLNTGSPKNSVPLGPEHPRMMFERYTSDYPRDTLAMLDAALQRLGTPDAPVHITGGSNGGYMTNWLVATTDRFTSAAADRSITHLLSEFGSSDIGFHYVPLEHGGNPWEHHELLWGQSPLKYAQQVRTPLLILHGEEDLRCPISQAEEWFTALKYFGNAPVRFVRFAGESHDMSRNGRPDRRVRRIEEIVAWFGKY